MGADITCGMIMGHTTCFNADLNQTVKSFWLPIAHTHTHGLCCGAKT